MFFDAAKFWNTKNSERASIHVDTYKNGKLEYLLNNPFLILKERKIFKNKSFVCLVGESLNRFSVPDTGNMTSYLTASDKKMQLGFKKYQISVLASEADCIANN